MVVDMGPASSTAPSWGGGGGPYLISNIIERGWDYLVTSTSSDASSFSDFQLIALGTFIVHEIAFIMINVPYLLMDDYNWLQQYKIYEKTKTTSSERWSLFYSLLKAHVTQLLPIMVLSYPLFRFFGFHCDKTLPSWKSFAFQMVVFNILEDTGFYWVHRYLHTPWAYKKFHFRHHEFIDTFSLVGEIAHPVEFFANFLTPMMIGPFLLGYLQGVHIVTFWAWISFRALRGSDAHSGYNLPFHPLRLLSPIYGGPVYHAFHHKLAGRSYNFGGYKIWDKLMNTSA